MASLVTPVSDVRRLRFSTSDDFDNPRFEGPFPSPYTPFSGRRSGSLPSGTPQLPVTSNESISVETLPPDSTDIYIHGGLDETLRSVNMDTVSSIRSRYPEPDVEAAMNFVIEMVGALEGQLSASQEILETQALHPHIRRRIQLLQQHLRLEHESWLLINAAWRPGEVQTRDMYTRRLAPDVLDDRCVLRLDGYHRCQRIVEWLEQIADDALQRSGGVQLKPLDDPAYRWEYTAENHGYEPVSMDFPQTTMRSLDEIEQKAEARLSREIFRLVRAGRLEQAEAICRSVGQPWRAAAIGGGKRGYAISANGVKGHARKTWRMAASAVARSSQPGITPHERAVCGVLAGVLEPVLAVAKSYEDQAWARLNMLLDAVADRCLNGTSLEAVRILDGDILQAFFECDHAEEGLEAVPGDLLKGIRSVRAYLAIGYAINAEYTSELLKLLAGLARSGAERKNEWVCRFAAHICLFLKMSGLLGKMTERHADLDNYDMAIESYVRLVIRKDLEEEAEANKQGTILQERELVVNVSARYLSELSSEDRIIKTYSELLSASLKADLYHERMEGKRVGVAPIEIDKRRTLCLQKAGQCFSRDAINRLVIAATDLVWESALPENGSSQVRAQGIQFEVPMVDAISEMDQMAFRAIEFLIFPAFANYEEALVRVTTAARRFFLQGKQAAARELIAWFPSEIIAQIPAGSNSVSVHELDSWRMYMAAVSKHNEWNVFHTSRRPKPISEKVRSDAAADPGKVSYEVQASAGIQVERYRKENEEFMRSSKQYRDEAIESLRSALHFEGGWMSVAPARDNKDDFMLDHADTARQDEIDAVRRLVVPQLAILLHHVLHESGMYSEAIGLAQTIADDKLRLYENFGPSELSAFLSRIADSTVLFADSSIRSGDCKKPYYNTLFEENAEQ